MKWKVWISYIFFIFITIVVATFLSVIVTEQNSENAGIRAFYEEPRQMDAVFIGPSSIYTAFLPPIAYHKYGITTAVYAITAMVAEQYIHVVKDVMKYQTPKVLVIVADAIAPMQRRISDEKVGIKSISFVRPSIKKVKMIHAFKKEKKFNNLEILEYYFPIICFHSRWKDLKGNSILFDSNSHKGAILEYRKFYEKNTNKNLYKNEQREDLQIDESRKQIDPNLYIQDLLVSDSGLGNAINKEDKEREIEILQYVKNVEELFSYVSTLKNTKVIMLVTPSLVYERDFERYQYLFYMAEKYGIDSFYVGDCEGLNIDYNNDFFDEVHLNFWGAVKVTDYLSTLLIREYGLQDKRKDSKYKSWDEEYEFYKNTIKNSFNIDVETGELINSEINE